jgi:hypothetical protein
MEFLIVRFAEIDNRKDVTDNQGQVTGTEIKYKFLANRELIVGEENHGTTNQAIELTRGTHTITLGSPEDFTPNEVTVVLKDTSVISPMEVRFEKI